MSLTISGAVAISGASNAYASACCNGEGRTLLGGNGRGTATANGNALVHAGTTLTLSAGSLAVSGGKHVDGSACCVGERGGTTGNATVTVNANAELSAGQSMALTVSGPVNIAGGASAYASACCVGEGGVGLPGGNGQATVTASANALLHAGTDLTLTAGSLTVHGGDRKSVV